MTTTTTVAAILVGIALLAVSSKVRPAGYRLGRWIAQRRHSRRAN